MADVYVGSYFDLPKDRVVTVYLSLYNQFFKHTDRTNSALMNACAVGFDRTHPAINGRIVHETPDHITIDCFKMINLSAEQREQEEQKRAVGRSEFFVYTGTSLVINRSDIALVSVNMKRILMDE